MRISVIVPVLNEAAAIAATLDALRRGAPGAEIIVVDGGSTDSTKAVATPRCDLLIEAPRGRARQLNAGAARASGQALAFVHADTIVPASFGGDIKRALADQRVAGGRFDLELDDPRMGYRIVGRLISLRSRLSRTATGDQAIFARHAIFNRLGGFPEIELCEDLEFSRRLRRVGRVACLHSRVTTSARRWREQGLVLTVLRMWTIRLLYLLGVSPARLSRYYAGAR